MVATHQENHFRAQFSLGDDNDVVQGLGEAITFPLLKMDYLSLSKGHANLQVFKRRQPMTGSNVLQNSASQISR